MKQLVFEVVDHTPEKSYQAQWTGSDWVVMDGDGLIWNLGGSEFDASEAAAVESSAGTDASYLERILAVALHSDAAVASVKGD